MSAAVLVSKPRVYIRRFKIFVQEIREKAESLRKVSGISDAANDGTC
jgi:hypothetical protein